MALDRQLAAERLNAKSVTVLQTLDISHVGWESDTEAWIVKTDKGTVHALSTNHGSLYLMTATELPRQRAELEKQIQDIDAALKLLEKK